MNRSFLDVWLRNIYKTLDEEISCSECFDFSSQFVELEISGRNAAVELPRVKQHLDQCRACREEYETLRDLVLADDQNALPCVDDLRNSIH